MKGSPLEAGMRKSNEMMRAPGTFVRANTAVAARAVIKEKPPHYGQGRRLKTPCFPDSANETVCFDSTTTTTTKTTTPIIN